MLLQIALFHSFLWLSNIPIYVYVYTHRHMCVYVYIYTSYLSVHLLMDTSMFIVEGCFHVLAIVS